MWACGWTGIGEREAGAGYDQIREKKVKIAEKRDGIVTNRKQKLPEKSELLPDPNPAHPNASKHEK